ncbi:hypothetical protein QJU23_03720 [Pasteurella atlantica]|uniref:Uncharacterized protein n=2 Tax=Pasteurellaceae TaxID=712 RepID=A0ACC6HL05_9PAST|nr:hypothetical protein [Pasteurella atlantica]MDP8051535.1 hypothetical protein [Pasteurella atlantica]MDP8104886.1 hypothetical protein [Pasteurella atlantica]MDP8148260.1 hypothetical protein [Pasteurella atlantica]
MMEQFVDYGSGINDARMMWQFIDNKSGNSGAKKYVLIYGS